MSVFSDFVRLRREELNVDQAGLARQLGVHQQTVSKWEQAKAVPRPERIRALAEVLRVEPIDLMKYAGYLVDDMSTDAPAEDPLQRLLGQVTHLANDQLILLIDHAWAEYRSRVGFPLDGPRRRSARSGPGDGPATR